MYADDTITLTESETGLQQALNSIYEYCKSWNLEVNPSKSKIIILSRGKLRVKPVLMYNNNPKDIAEDFVYLGVKLN